MHACPLAGRLAPRAPACLHAPPSPSPPPPPACPPAHPPAFLQVTYAGSRRFKLLTVDHDSRPYPLAAATWLDDQPPTDPTQQQLTDTLELDVYALLKQVAKYSAQLAAGTSRSSTSNSSSTHATSSDSKEQEHQASSVAAQVLPDALFTYAPPPPAKRSVAEYLIQTGHPAGGQIATWQRMGSVYGDTAAKKKLAQDPYQVCEHFLGSVDAFVPVGSMSGLGVVGVLGVAFS